MRLAKRALSILLSAILIFSVFTIIPITTASAADGDMTTGVTIGKWIKGTNVTRDGNSALYQFSDTDLYAKVHFVRMAKDQDPSWDNKVNQTLENGNPDVGYPRQSGTDTFSLQGWGGSNNAYMTGAWYDYGNVGSDELFLDAADKNGAQFAHTAVDWYIYTWQDFDLTEHEESSSTCEIAGNYLYYTSGDRYFMDDGNGGYQQVAEDDTIKPLAAHQTEYVAEAAAGCITNGTTAHYECTVCHKCFSDAEGTSEVTPESLTISAQGHDMTHNAEVPASCTQEGAFEHWHCSRCNKNFADADGSIELTGSLAIPVSDHTLTHHDAVAATSTADGNIEYWQCSVCEKYFSDENGENEITEDQTVIPFTGVAQVGDVKYTTLAAAVEAANGEQPIKVLADGLSYQLAVGEHFLLAKDSGYTPTFTTSNAEYYVTYTTETNWYNVYLAQYAVKAVVPGYGTYYFTEAQMNSDHWLYNVYNGTTITLLTDMTYTKNVAYGITSAKSFTLDMGGHTLTFAAPAAETHSIFSRSNNTITVRNGRILFTTDDGFWMKGGTLNVENGAILEATNGYSPIVMSHDGVVNIKPGAQVKSVNSWAIATNGSGGNGGYTINITGGEVTATNAPAIYHANTGTLNISGGSVTGTDALFIKSGTTNISGGTFTATGEHAEFVHNPNGTNSTGDAIVIESTTGYSPIDSISITDGTFISTAEGTKAVATYANGQGQEEQTGFIEGGNFSTQVENEMCAEGYAPMTTLVDGFYHVTSAEAEIGTVGYLTFADAAAARETDDDVITLLADIEDAYTLAVDETLKVEKGDFTITVNEPVGDDVVFEVSEADGITTYKAVSFAGIVYSATLSLKDCIDINFYVKNVPANTDRSDYSMTYTFHDTDTTCDIPADNGSSIVVASCAAKEMTDTVDIVVKYKDTVIKTIEDYSVSQYCYNKLNSDQSSDELKALCDSALTYGLYAQEYFVYEQDNEPVPNDPDVSGVVVPADYAPVSTGQCDSVKKISATLILESETQLNFYVTPVNGKTVDDLNITITKGGQPVEDITVTYDGATYHANISGIAAKDLDEAYTLTVSDGSGERQIIYSPLSYAYSKQNNSDENLANCARSLYNYYLKAEAYFASGKTN